MHDDTLPPALAALEGSYEIVRELGRGGTALVYLARERASHADVAIKVVRAGYLDDGETLARFAREARYVGELHHPNVVALRSVVALGASGLALVMDHVRGRTLKQLIQEHGPLVPERAESVLRDIASALAAAHAMGIVHRDVKPENIFVDEEGRALLADFGVARSMTNETQLTMSGIAIGTPAYMAPEQIDGVPLDGRGDIYSLGLVGWEMLTGKRPWDGSGLYAVIYRQKHEELPDVRDMRAGIPDRLAEVIAGAIEKDRANRWQSAEELIAALDGTATRRAPRPRPMVVADHTRRFVRPNAPADGADDVVAGSLQATLQELEAAEPAGPPPSISRRRLAIGAGAVAALLVASLAVVLSTSRADSWVQDQPGGPVEAGVQAGAPANAPADSLTPRASDTARGDVRTDSPRSEQLDVVPAPVVAASDASPDAAAVPPEPVRAPAMVPTAAVAPAAAPAAEVNAPSPLPPPATRARVSIAAGGAHTCLVMANGRAFCWGANDRGQLGTGSTARLSTPGPVASGVRFASIASGLSHSCALTRNGAVWCWGENAHGQLGDASFADRRAPVRIRNDHAFRAVATGARHTCALDVEGQAWCWGAGSAGQLGNGDTGASAAPVAVATDHRFTTLAAGWAFSCGLTDAGAVMCWGENASGQLGDGTRDARRTPTPVHAAARFTAIAAGSNHACGLTEEGEAWCWGRNARGQLGDGTTGAQSAPVPVKTTARFVAISAGAVHTCAITGDGAAYCWGQNAYGQLGDGGTSDRTQPVAVAGHHAFALLRAFGSHTCGATASGEAFCWGYNLEGQLGDGTRVHRARPVYVEPPPGQ